MNSGRKEYTFFWSIENYTYCWHKNGEELISPLFRSDELQGTSWCLHLYPKGMLIGDQGHISLGLRRSDYNHSFSNVALNIELSALATNGSPLYSVKNSCSFYPGYAHTLSKFLKRDEILLQRRDDYLPQDILTVGCKIWIGEGNVCNIGQSSARTRIKVEKICFLHEVERFSTLQPNVKQTIHFQSHSTDISSSLYINEVLLPGKDIIIQIVPKYIRPYINFMPYNDINFKSYNGINFKSYNGINFKSYNGINFMPYSDNNFMPYNVNEIGTFNTFPKLCKCEIYLLDRFGNEVECGKADNRYNAKAKIIRVLPLSLTRMIVLGKKSEYLPDDKLSLLFKCTFSFGLDFERIEETWHGISRAALKPSNNDTSTLEKTSAYPSIIDEIKDLYINKSLIDVHLKTKTKLFSAHKVVLCARSPVFKAMLTSDMEEKNTDCIQVDDLGDDVVQQLLLFLHSDTTENLHWEMATQLYYAADKYQIGKLKKVCYSFLIKNITPTNAGELLLLADTHSDTDLKKFVESYILENKEQVVCSDEWQALNETHPVLVMTTMCLKYKKRNIKSKRKKYEKRKESPRNSPRIEERKSPRA